MSCRIFGASSSQGARRGLATPTLPTPLLTLPTFLPTLASRPERSGNAWQRELCEKTRSRNAQKRAVTAQIVLTR